MAAVYEPGVSDVAMGLSRRQFNMKQRLQRGIGE
jgi:hypothetical protein